LPTPEAWIVTMAVLPPPRQTRQGTATASAPTIPAASPASRYGRAWTKNEVRPVGKATGHEAAGTMPKQKLIRFLAVVGVLSLLWALYVVVSPEAVDLPPERMNVAAGLPASATMTALAANLGSPALAGNRVDLLVNGDEIFPPMLDSIRGARGSINFVTYVYWQGDIAESFANELAAAARRGVEVRVLLDAFGARKIDDRWVEMMQRAGCQVVWFRPLRWNNLRRVLHRTHRKLLVVDGTVGFTGGVGIAEEWTGDAQDPQHWRDDHFRIEGPAVRYLQGSFAEDWRLASGVVLAGERIFPTIDALGTAAIVPISAAANERFAGIPFTYWFLFGSARERIMVQTPYYVPDPSLELGLLAAARRGVDVTLLVPGEHQDSIFVRYASRTYYRDLLQAGVRVFEYRPTFLHVKVMVIDDELSLIGSPNFDSRSTELNRELALAVRDRALVEALEVSIAQDVARSDELTLAEVDQWSLLARARNYASRLLREQL
jgi:cardiolipin synthase